MKRVVNLLTAVQELWSTCSFLEKKDTWHLQGSKCGNLSEMRHVYAALTDPIAVFILPLSSICPVSHPQIPMGESAVWKCALCKSNVDD